MTIKNITTLKNFGIFSDLNTDAKDFGRYNLFYGWNGSGKSTLSRLFRSIENHNIPNRFPSAEFKIRTDGDTLITNNNITDARLNIYTFNHDFIDENISWDDLVKSILLVDKEKIEEREKLEALKKQQKSDLDEHKKTENSTKRLKDDISKFSSDSARQMKNSLQAIDTTDRYYLNYDKRKFETFIKDNIDATKSDKPLLDDSKIKDLINSAKPNQKPSITYTEKTLSGTTLAKAKERLDSLLKSSVVSKTIKRLTEHNDIKSWIETGLELHKAHDTNKCELCGNTITIERINQLEAHFNDDYKAFQERLESANTWLESQYIKVPALPSPNEFYEEFKTEYSNSFMALEESINSLNSEIQAWHTALKKKTNNQLDTQIAIKAISENAIKAYNDSIIAIHKTVEKHNYKSKNFQEETNKAKKNLELHYVTTEVKSFKYHEKKKEVSELEQANINLKKEIESRKKEINILEDSLSNEGLGADKFNESLHRFLGRSELSLRFNPTKKGYEILRNNEDLAQGNLSEGEKTAIAFVYFITKLKENDNKISDTIVVIDDPISSFDSNHLFHAYSFLKTNCENAKQLFVFTHNFTFFKLVRDWISRKKQPKK